MTEEVAAESISSLAFVGAGPRTTGILERLAANFGALWPDGALQVHVVDPFPPGAGRVWRLDQPANVLMNSRACEVTMFTDDSVNCSGPIIPGPSLSEWVARHGVQGSVALDLAAEARALTPRAFPSRRLGGQYLAWCFQWAVAALPPQVEVLDHRAEVVALDDAPGGKQSIALSDGRCLLVDAVVLALGGVGGALDPAQRRHAGFAARHSGSYLPPHYAVDHDHAALPAGVDVIVSGFGLAFIDLLVLLTEGRGGRFARSANGDLRYHPSGAEPVLWVGSRRGVPHLPKVELPLLGEAPGPTRFVTPEVLKSLPPQDSGGSVPALSPDANPDLWSLVMKEVGWGYYRELFTAHPARTRVGWDEFSSGYERCDWDSPEMGALVSNCVAPQDRLDLERAWTPLAGRGFPAEPALAAALRGHVRKTIEHATDPRHSAWAGAARSLFEVGNHLGEFITSRQGALSPGEANAVERISTFTSFFTSGPPAFRLEQVVALSRTGLLRFLGAGLRVRENEASGAFTATSRSLPEVVRSPHFVEARLPEPDVLRLDNMVLRGLVERGHAVAWPSADGHAHRLAAEELSHRVLDRSGRAHPRRYALGSFATGGGLGSFSRPRTNSPFFRQNDSLARRLIRQLRALAPH